MQTTSQKIDKTLQDDFQKYLEFKQFQEMIQTKQSISESPKKQLQKENKSKYKTRHGKNSAANFGNKGGLYNHTGENGAHQHDSPSPQKNDTAFKSGNKSLFNQGYAKPPAAPSSAQVFKKSKFKNENKENLQSLQTKEPNLSSNALSDIKNNFTAKSEPKLDRKNFQNLQGGKNELQFENCAKDQDADAKDLKMPNQAELVKSESSTRNPEKSAKISKIQKIESQKDDAPPVNKVEAAQVQVKKAQNLRDLMDKPKKDEQNLRELIDDTRLASKAKDKKQAEVLQMQEKSKEKLPEPKEVLGPRKGDSLRNELIELKNESAAKSLNKSMIVNGSPTGKQPQPKWPASRTKTEMDMKKLQERLLKLNGSDPDSTQGLMVLMKEIFSALSQDQKDQLATHMVAKFSCLGSSKDSDSTATELNEQQSLQIIKETRGENAKLQNSIKQQTEYINNLQAKLSVTVAELKEAEINKQLDKQTMSDQMSSRQVCTDCNKPNGDSMNGMDRDPPMYNDMKLGKRNMHMRGPSPPSQPPTTKGMPVRQPRKPVEEPPSRDFKSLDNDQNCGLQQLDKIIGKYEQNKRQKHNTKYGMEKGAIRNQVNKNRGGSKMGNDFHKPDHQREFNNNETQQNKQNFKNDYKDHRDQRDGNRDFKQVRFHDHEDRSQPKQDGICHKKLNNWNNDNTKNQNSFHGKNYQKDSDAPKRNHLNSNFSKPHHSQKDGNENSHRPQFNGPKKERVYHGNNDQNNKVHYNDANDHRNGSNVKKTFNHSNISSSKNSVNNKMKPPSSHAAKIASELFNKDNYIRKEVDDYEILLHPVPATRDEVSQKSSKNGGNDCKQANDRSNHSSYSHHSKSINKSFNQSNSTHNKSSQHQQNNASKSSKPYNNNKRRPMGIVQEMKRSLQDNSVSNGSQRKDIGEQFEYLSNRSIPVVDIAKLSSEQKPVSEVLSQKCSKNDYSRDIGVVNTTDLLGETLQVDQSNHVEEESKILATSEQHEAKNDASAKKEEESKHSSAEEPDASHITSYEIKPMNYEEIHQFFDEESDHGEDGGELLNQDNRNGDGYVQEPDAAFDDQPNDAREDEQPDAAFSDHKLDEREEPEASDNQSAPKIETQISSKSKQLINMMCAEEKKDVAVKKPEPLVFEMDEKPNNNATSDEAKDFIVQFQQAIDKEDGAMLSELLFDAELADGDVVSEIDIGWYEKMAAKLIQ